METFSALSPFRAVAFVGWLLLMSAAAPVWALPRDLGELPATALFSGDPPLSEDAAEMIHALESFPDVAVFPIRVAGPVVASSASSGSLAYKLALGAGEASIAVIYPDIGEPYRSVFAQIIAGIEDKVRARVSSYPVGTNVDIGELNSALHRQETRVVIALGRQGLKVASALDRNIGVVVGGVLTAPESEMRDLPVITLTPDPALLFSRLKGLMPGVRRVFTVVDSRQNGWLVRLAKDAARVQGLELVAYEAQDLRSAMRAYQEILAAADSRQDALWLLQDTTTVEEGAVLPMVLQESWNRNLAVFSSSFGHVRRGVLFSLYPNNVEMGHHLGGSALGFLASGDHGTRGMIPLREVLMAVNLRTAKHLGLNPGHGQGFDMTFPEQ